MNVMLKKYKQLINKTLERSLRLIKNDKTSTFEHLLQANNEITTHQRNVQVLMVEVFKMINGFAPPIMKDLFLFRENTHYIQNFQMISNESKKTVRHGLETVKYRALLLWANLPEKYKTATSLNSSKTKIKTWTCETCIFLLLYCVCVKRITLCNCLCSSSPSSFPSRAFASVIRNVGKFGAKNYFTDHQTANGIYRFR